MLGRDRSWEGGALGQAQGQEALRAAEGLDLRPVYVVLAPDSLCPPLRSCLPLQGCSMLASPCRSSASGQGMRRTW